MPQFPICGVGATPSGLLHPSLPLLLKELKGGNEVQEEHLTKVYVETNNIFLVEGIS